jgi:hypothetical protein
MTDIAKYPPFPVYLKSLISLWFSGCVPSCFLVVTSYVKSLKTLIARVCVSPVIYIYIGRRLLGENDDPLRITYE